MSESPFQREGAPGLQSDRHRSLLALVASSGDREAFRALFVHFGPRVKALMLRAGAAGDQADDIVQEVMATVWNKVALYDPAKGSVSAWIFTIARNARIDRLRRRSSRPYEDLDDLDLPSEGPDAEQLTNASQIAEAVAGALAELPRDQREVIELAYTHDLSQSEIAERLALPLGTIKSRMRLAYGRLKTRLVALR